MYLEQEYDIEYKDTDILIIIEERGGINIRENVDECNEEYKGKKYDIVVEVELEEANEENIEEEDVIEDVINND